MKSFLGPRLRRLREERGMTQLAVAKILSVSPSYYNQLENNQRPLTTSLMTKMSSAFSLDAEFFAEDDEGRVFADVREALNTSVPDSVVSATELREFARNHPALAHALVAIYRRQRAASERATVMAHALAGRGGELSYAPPLAPHEEVRDFFYARHNYIGPLDEYAERLARDLGLLPGETLQRLTDYLAQRHRVEIVTEPASHTAAQRQFDPRSRRLHVPARLLPGQRAFQLATQLGLLEARELIQEIANEGGFASNDARTLARIGLSH